MDTSQIVLEYLRVFLSGPVIGGTVALTLIFKFRKNIESLIDRVLIIKFPGGGEVITSQQKRAEEEIAPKEEPPQLSKSQQVSLPDSVTLTPEQGQRVLQLIQSERTNSVLWEYRYLNYYLARGTQLALDWLGSLQQPIAKSLFDSNFQILIPDANERTAILSALQNHHLITPDPLLEITPKGRQYVTWRGPMKPPNQDP